MLNRAFVNDLRVSVNEVSPESVTGSNGSSTSASGVSNLLPDYKLEKISSDRRRLLNYEDLKASSLYIEGSNLFYSYDLASGGGSPYSDAKVGSVPSGDVNVGRVINDGSNDRIAIYGEHYELLGEDNYKRLRNAYLIGDNIYSAERYEGTSSVGNTDSAMISSSQSSNTIVPVDEEGAITSTTEDVSEETATQKNPERYSLKENPSSNRLGKFVYDNLNNKFTSVYLFDVGIFYIDDSGDYVTAGNINQEGRISLFCDNCRDEIGLELFDFLNGAVISGDNIVKS